MDQVVTQNKNFIQRPVRATKEEPSKKQRIKVWMAAALIITAASIDAFQALLNILIGVPTAGVGTILGSIISVCADVIFAVWFWLLGVGFIRNPKVFAAMFTQAVIGLIPALDTLPELTLGIATIVFITMVEDRSDIINKVSGIINKI